MNLNDFLSLLTRLTYFGLGVVTLLSFLRHRDRARFDIMLVFAAYAIAVTFQQLALLNHGDPALNLVNGIAALAQPYLQLRVVDQFRRVSAGFKLFGLAGMVVSCLLLPFLMPDLPLRQALPALPPAATLTATLLIVGWYALVEGYATVAFIRGALTTAGVTRWRMSLASLGSAAIVLVIGSAGASLIAPALAPYVSGAAQFLSVASALGYYFGFAPPRFLRHWWQSAELYHFLQEVNRIAPERRGRESLDRLCDASNRAVGALASAVVLWRERAQRFELVAVRTISHVPLPASTIGDDDVLGRAWRERRALVAQTPERPDANYSIASAVGARALIAVPIISARRPWGALVAFLRHAPLFADDDLNLLSLFVEQAAVILDHEDMLDEQRAQTTRAHVLAEITQALAEVIDDLPGLLSGIAHRVVELLGDACVVSLLSSDGQLLEPVAIHDADPGQLDDLRIAAPARPAGAADSLRGKVVRTGRAVRVDDLAAQAPNGEASASSIHALLIVPLRVRAKVIGTIGLSRHQAGNPYTSDDQRFVQDIADRAALAIATALENVERRLAEQALRESEERFSKAFRVSPVAMAIARLDSSQFIDVNESWTRLFGYAREEALGRTAFDLGLYLTPAREAQLSTAAANGEAVRDVELDICTKAGVQRQALLSVAPVELSGVRSTLSIAYDISERKQAEEALRRQTTVLAEQARLLELAHDAILVRALDGTVRFWNHGAEEMYGWSCDEVLGQAAHTLLETRFPVSMNDVIGELMRTGHWEGELEHTRRDGQHIIVASRWALQRDENAKPMGILEINNDISERKQSEQALRAQTSLYESFLRAQSDLGDGVSITEDARFVYANEALARMYGYSMPELLALPSFMELVAPEERQRLAPRLRQRLSGESLSDSGETIAVRKDGRRINIEYATKLMVIKGKTQLFSIIRDISDRKRAEQELREIAADLARSNADLEQFAYVASHDLQEPLQMVSSFVQLLKRRYADRLDKDADEFIHYAVDGAARMQTLINDLLDYSRVGTRAKPLGCVNTERVLAQTLLNLRLTLEDQHAVVTHDALPEVKGDESQLVQLFQNLVSNGVKFRGEQPPWVHLSAARNDGMWQFCVRDNGIGIDPQYSERIFTIFQRLHKRTDYPGTGIGLAVCKKIVERHGGKIWVESSAGQGATFYFTLPDARSANV